MKQILLSVVVCVASTVAMADVTALSLNQKQVTVNNQLGDTVFVERTSATPTVVRVALNPRQVTHEVCTMHQTRGSFCGSVARCNSFGYHGGCYAGPAGHCFEDICLKWADRTEVVYKEVTLNFKNANPVATGQKDVIEIRTSGDASELGVRLFSGTAPYNIQRGGMFHRNTYYFEQGGRPSKN